MSHNSFIDATVNPNAENGVADEDDSELLGFCDNPFSMKEVIGVSKKCRKSIANAALCRREFAFELSVVYFVMKTIPSGQDFAIFVFLLSFARGEQV